MPDPEELECKKMEEALAEMDSSGPAPIDPALANQYPEEIRLKTLVQLGLAGMKESNICVFCCKPLPGLTTDSIFFCLLFVKSLKCLKGKLMTPHRGNTFLLCSYQQLLRLSLGPFPEGLFELNVALRTLNLAS